MITKNKYGKGVLTSIFFPLLLKSSDLHSYDSESRKMHTKVDVSKAGEGGGGGGGRGQVDFRICSARGQMT